MGRKKESVTLYMEPEQWARFKALSERTKVPAAVFVREALDEWLARRPPLPPPEEPAT